MLDVHDAESARALLEAFVGHRAMLVLIEQINLRTYPYRGAKLSPLEAWLLIRGLPTLPLRLAQHMRGGPAVAELLMGHPQVELVRHPALAALQQSAGANSFLRFGVSRRRVGPHVGLDSPESLWADLTQSPARATRRTAPQRLAEGAQLAI